MHLFSNQAGEPKLRGNNVVQWANFHPSRILQVSADTKQRCPVCSKSTRKYIEARFEWQCRMPAMFIKRKRQHQERLLKSVKVSKKISNPSTIREIIRSFGNDFPSKPITQLDLSQCCVISSSVINGSSCAKNGKASGDSRVPWPGARVGDWSIFHRDDPLFTT